MLNDCSSYCEVKSAVNIFLVKAESRTRRRETSFKVFTGLDSAEYGKDSTQRKVYQDDKSLDLLHLEFGSLQSVFCKMQCRHQS